MKDEVIKFRSGAELKRRLIKGVGIGKVSSYLRNLVEEDLDSESSWVGPQFKNDKFNREVLDEK